MRPLLISISPAHVCNMSSVSVRLENRIRKIAEAMEANNKKNVLKLGQALIKEFPTAPLAKVRVKKDAGRYRAKRWACGCACEGARSPPAPLWPPPSRALYFLSCPPMAPLPQVSFSTST